MTERLYAGGRGFTYLYQRACQVQYSSIKCVKDTDISNIFIYNMLRQILGHLMNVLMNDAIARPPRAADELLAIHGALTEAFEIVIVACDSYISPAPKDISGCSAVFLHKVSECDD